MSLDAIFRPRAVAVVGASRKRGTIAAEVFHNLLRTGFPGAIYPVNPQADVVQSVRAYPRVADIPDAVDLAVIVVPAARVVDAVIDCGEKGVKGVIVITAGFAEIGAEGAARQEELISVVRRYGMRLVGPNCLGVVNAEPGVALNATFAPTFPPFGNVAFSSQSGALGLAIIEVARELGVGISQFVSMGNRADVSGNDLIAHWEADPATEVVLLYLENLGNPRHFMDIARRVSRKKPIVVVKSGRTEAGARAASSHTGSLAGVDVAVDALLGQAGVIRTDTIDEMFDVAMLLANQPVPRGRRVGILTNAGGPGIMATDALASRGLDVVRLSDATQARLAAFLPTEASVKNPVDMIASASATQYADALDVLARGNEVDAIVVLFVTPIVTEARDVAAAILGAAARSNKTILTCFMGRHGVPEAVSSLRQKHVPSYAFPESAAAALAKAVRYGEWLASPAGAIPALDDIDVARAHRVLRGMGPNAHVSRTDNAARADHVAQPDNPDRTADATSRWLTPGELAEVLGAYGIPTPRAAEAVSADAAVACASAVGFPLAMKLASDTITHKSDVGGVVLGLRTADDVGRAFDAMAARLDAMGRRAEMRGVLLQEMVESGVELFIGATRDPDFGHLIGFGIGGVHVELWKDIVFRVAPLRDVDARAMLEQIRARALLDGFRGAPPVDKDAVVSVLLRLSRLVADFPEIVELDINPLVAQPGRAIAVDARIRVGAR